jgi:2'-5' RNA ligase
MLRQCSLFDEPPGGIGMPSLAPPLRVADVPGRVHSLFFALLPEPDDAVRVHAHARQVEESLGFAGRAVDAERLHVTLHSLGAWDGAPAQDEVDRWCRAAAAVRRAPFEVVFDQVATFGGRDNAWVFTSSEEAELHSLHEALGIALANTGERVVRQRIAPHMTVSWRGRRIAAAAIAPVRWRAHELALVDSHHGEHAHDVLGRWALGG